MRFTLTWQGELILCYSTRRALVGHSDDLDQCHTRASARGGATVRMMLLLVWVLLTIMMIAGAPLACFQATRVCEGSISDASGERMQPHALRPV